METGTSSALQARARYRHELRTLTYVTLDQANGGIVRNLTHEGIAVQAVAAVRPKQQLRVRFELRYPRLRIETRGEVVWSTFSGQCGIRFLDLSPRVARQIDEWIFGDLLEGGGLNWNPEPVLIGSERPESKMNPLALGERMPGERLGVAAQPARISSVVADAALSLAGRRGIGKIDEVREVEEPEEIEEDEPQFAMKLTGEAMTDDGLLVSPAQLKVIPLPEPAPSAQPKPLSPMMNAIAASAASRASMNGAAAVRLAPPTSSLVREQLDWLSQPLAGRSLAWTVDGLIVLASALLGIFVFLSVTREAPQWPLTMAVGGAIVVLGLYWGFFKLFGGASFGTRLARLADADLECDREPDARFR
jgi:PilZ domain